METGGREDVMDSRDANLKQRRSSDQSDVGDEAEGRWQGSLSPSGQCWAMNRQKRCYFPEDHHAS